ncbi:MAG: hypothetical protein WD533_07830 [Dehalococcoidia bacterium]
MLRVTPLNVHNSGHAMEAHLQLAFQDREGHVSIPITREQATQVASELQGIPTASGDALTLTAGMARGLGAEMSRVVLTASSQNMVNTHTTACGVWGYLSAKLHVRSPSATADVDVDVVLGIILAMRLGLPLLIDGPGLTDPRERSSAGTSEAKRFCNMPIPMAFQEALDDIQGTE